VQTDPIGAGSDANLYAYAANSPPNYVDSSGEEYGAAFSSINRHTTGEVTSDGSSPAVLLDAIPVVGDIKGAIETIENPSWLGAISTIVGIAPGGDFLKPIIKNSDVVVRGGADIPGGGNSVEGLAAGTSTHTDSGLTGFSAEASPGATLCELCTNIPNNQVGVTTAGDIRALGGEVTPTTGRSPNHVTVTGLPPEDANKLLTPTQPNPVPKDQRTKW